MSYDIVCLYHDTTPLIAGEIEVLANSGKQIDAGN